MDIFICLQSNAALKGRYNIGIWLHTLIPTLWFSRNISEHLNVEMSLQ